MLHDRLVPGTLLDGRYLVMELVKAGGMGAVYKVSDQKLNGKIFALKEMLPASNEPTEQQEAKTRFITEIQVMQNLIHPNIPKVSSSFIHGNSFYFVMEFIEGTDLSRVLKKEGNPGLPPQTVVNWAVQILDALDYLHSQSPPIVHRDIKPSNLLYRQRDQRILLIDFGIARVTNPGEGYWIGTPGYAPPEQQQGKHEPRSDLYALGATMHELLTGVKPKGWEFPSFKELGLDIDPELESVIADALMYSPTDRISSAKEMSRRLQNLNSFTVLLPETDHEHKFEVAVQELKDQAIDPMLKELIKRYNHECHTPYLPRKLDYLKFVLACPTTFELHIIKDTQNQTITFQEKQGLLTAVTLGEVDPLSITALEEVKSIIQQFTENYEKFRGSSWQAIY